MARVGSDGFLVSFPGFGSRLGVCLEPLAEPAAGAPQLPDPIPGFRLAQDGTAFSHMSGFQAQDQQRAAAAAILLSPSTLTAFASKEGIPVARAQLKLIKARAGSVTTCSSNC